MAKGTKKRAAARRTTINVGGPCAVSVDRVKIASLAMENAELRAQLANISACLEDVRAVKVQAQRSRDDAHAVLEALVETINMTGGVVPCSESLDPESPFFAPAEHTSWGDLGKVYFDACQILGVAPFKRVGVIDGDELRYFAEVRTWTVDALMDAARSGRIVGAPELGMALSRFFEHETETR